MPKRKLTKSVVDRSTYAGQNGAFFAIWDTEVMGFGLRVYPGGSKTYIIKYRAQGRQRIFKVGHSDKYTVDEARARARKKLVEVDDGIDPMEEKLKQKNKPTIEELTETYMNLHASKKKSGHEDKRRIERYILPAFGKRLVENITPIDIETEFNRIGTKSIYEANKFLRLTKAMFNLAPRWGFPTGPNPCNGIKQFKEAENERTVAKEDMPALLDAVDDCPNAYVKAAIWVYLYTGLRKEELLKLKWEDVDLSRLKLTLLDTKTEKKQTQDIPPGCADILKELSREEGNPYIFVGRKQGHHLVNISKPWYKIRDAAGQQGLKLHDLRRTLGSWMVDNGESLVTVMKTLRHKSLRPTLVYARVSDSTVAEAVEANAERLENIRMVKNGEA